MPSPRQWRGDVAALRPMLATLAEHPLDDRGFVYEPKYDGIRALAAVDPGPGGPSITLLSRLGNEKSAQFPDIVRVLTDRFKRRTAPLVLDGEIVALDSGGAPTELPAPAGPHPRDSWTPPTRRSRSSCSTCSVMATRTCATCRCPTRRERLLKIVGRQSSTRLRISEQVQRRRPRTMAAGDGAGLGRPDCQARVVAVPDGQAVARLDQAEARRRAGVRHRRLDRAARHALLLRRAAARRLRARRIAHLRRPRRHGLRRARAEEGLVRC